MNEVTYPQDQLQVGWLVAEFFELRHSGFKTQALDYDTMLPGE